MEHEQAAITSIKKSMSRRNFLKEAALVGTVAATTGLVACNSATTENAASSTTGSIDSSEDGVVWPGKPLDISTIDITETKDCEVLVCGLGAGGSIAACACAQKGLNTIAIEKNEACGSVKTYICAVDSAPQKAAGLTFDKNRIAKEFCRYASGYANQRLIKTYLAESGAFVDWLDTTFKDDNVQCWSEYDVGDGWHDIFQLWPVQVGYHITYSADIQANLDAISNPIAKEMAAPGIATFAVAHAEADGADLMYKTSLVQLIQDSTGKVIGVLAKSEEDGHYLEIDASKGVILATGGYEADPDLLGYLNPPAAHMGGCDMSKPTNVGDGIRAGIWAGGAKDACPTFMTFERAALPVGVEPGYPYQGTSCWIGDQPFLKVTKDGERFCNETCPYDWPLHADSIEHGHVFCSIWDSDYVDSIKTFHTLGCSRIDPSTTPGSTEGLTFEALDAQIQAAMKTGCVMQADTIEELAEKLEMDAVILRTTVQRYNDLCEIGNDEDFGKPAKDMIALKNPPYYGSFFAGHVLCTVDGLQIDENCRVITADDQSPIEGLYATGNCSGSVFANTYPELLWGCANARTGTLALHIANELAEE